MHLLNTNDIIKVSLTYLFNTNVTDVVCSASDTPGDLEVVGISICDRKNTLSTTSYLTPGKAVRITTGAALPQGADAVVPVEDTLLLRETDDVSIKYFSY